MKDRQRITIEQIRSAEMRTPVGQYEAWANPDVRIPHSTVVDIWERELTVLLEDEKKEHLLNTAVQGVRQGISSLTGQDEYFSLNGYSQFEGKFFAIKNWGEFTQQYPEAAPFLEHLRVRIHALLRLDFQPEVIQAFEEYLEVAGYPNWNPNFFKRHEDKQAQSLNQWVRNHIKGFDGKTNWFMVVQRLSENAQTTFSQREENRTIEESEIIPLLTETLDEIIPIQGYWTPQILTFQWKALYEKIRRTYRTEAKRPDIGDVSEDASRPNWPAVLKQLPDQYRAAFRWHHGHEHRYRDEMDAVEEVIGALTQFQPEYWGPKWLDENGYPGVRLWWEKNYRDHEGKTDWERLLQQLPTNLQEGFTEFLRRRD